MFADLATSTLTAYDIDRAGSNFTHKGFVVAVRDIADAPLFPWCEEERWGVIRHTRSGYRHEKKPGWKLIGHPQGCGWAWYDVQESTAKAKRECWGVSDENMAALTAKLGRKPTRKQIIAEAVRLDMQRINAYLRRDIHTLLVEVALLSFDGKELTNFREVACEMPSDDIFMEAILEAADQLIDGVAGRVTADGRVMDGNTGWRVLDRQTLVAA